MMVIESLSQRVESDEAMHARAVPAPGDPRHDVDLLFDAQLILILEPFGKIDDRGGHQHQSRLLPQLAMKLIKLLRQLVAMAGVQESPSNEPAEQVVARIEFIRHGVVLERRQTSQYLPVLRCEVWLAKFLVNLLIHKNFLICSIATSSAMPSVSDSGRSLNTFQLNQINRNALRKCLRSCSWRQALVSFLCGSLSNSSIESISACMSGAARFT